MADRVGPITIRAERVADHAAIREVLASAFGSAAEADLVERLRASPGYIPEMALVALAETPRGPTPVGHVMISWAISVGHDGTERPVVMLSPLAVAPSSQRQGIGGALVLAVLRIADERRHPFVVLEGDPSYYGRFGFEPAAQHGLTLPLPDWAPPEAAQLRRLAAFDEGDACLSGRVVYPAAFDVLD
jgi:putative acetyltransferase